MFLKQYLILTTLIGFTSALGLSACGGEQVPSKYHWDQNPQALVASYGAAGGFVPAMMQFRESVYGSPFVRVMGDGTLYYGAPNKVSVRKLSAAEMQSLMAELRPDLFGDYKENYQAGQATDMPTTTIRINVEEWGDHQVGIYGLSQAGSASGQSALPTTLLEATKALLQAGSGGVAFKPAQIRMGAMQLDMTGYTQLDATKIKDWPVTGVDLNTAVIYGPPTTTGMVLSNQAQVDQVVTLLKGKEDVNFAENGVVFRQGSSFFWVAYVVMVP
jgi:hypothetical protein